MGRPPARTRQLGGGPRRGCFREVDVGCELGGPRIVRWVASSVGVVAPAAGCRDCRLRVRAEQALRLSAQEPRPAAADPPRRRSEPRPAQHIRDRRVRDADPDPLQLTLNTHVAPTGILARQAADQHAQLGGKQRAAGRPLPRPSAHQLPVPAAKRRSPHDEARPALPRKHAASGGQHRAIAGRVPRPASRPTSRSRADAAER
jgi:hypothetical protein